MKKVLMSVLALAFSSQAYAAGFISDFFSGNNLPTLKTLVLAGLLLFGFYFLLKFLFRQVHAFKLRTKSGIKVLESIPLNAKDTLVLVKVNQIKILVATTGNTVRPIHVFSKEIVPLTAQSTQAEQYQHALFETEVNRAGKRDLS